MSYKHNGCISIGGLDLEYSVSIEDYDPGDRWTPPDGGGIEDLHLWMAEVEHTKENEIDSFIFSDETLEKIDELIMESALPDYESDYPDC